MLHHYRNGLIVALLLLIARPAIADEFQRAEEAAARAAARAAAANAHNDKTKFLRIGRDRRGRAMTLDTAIVRYKNEDGVIVDLVGAVHVGGRGYYARLNRQFREYDVLLYELVAEKGAKPQDRKRKSAGGLGNIQGMMSKVLGLQHQLEGVDYDAKNFVHADMSPDQLKEKMAERGDSPMILFLEHMVQGMRQQNLQKNKPKFRNPDDDISDEEMLLGVMQGLLTGKGSPVVRRYMALQMGDLETQMKAFGGNLGKLIIDDRNQACFEVLDKQVANGKKHIGVFYGAAHLPDMEQRLLKRGFKKSGQVWLEAWELR